MGIYELELLDLLGDYLGALTEDNVDELLLGMQRDYENDLADTMRNEAQEQHDTEKLFED